MKDVRKILVDESGGATLTGHKDLLYCDLDGVIVDYDKFIHLSKAERSLPGFFANLPTIEGAIEAFKKLDEKFDVYILSTAPWSNPSAWMEKRLWVEKHLGDYAFKKLILSHNKGLLRGKYLIADREVNGVTNFEGEHIHFGTPCFPNWHTVLDYLFNKTSVFI